MAPGVPRGDVAVPLTQLCVALPLDYLHTPASTATSASASALHPAPAAAPPQQQVFAFLPLRSYGLRFVVQGDFIVPSSREAVDCDSPWNQALRSHLPTLLVKALEACKHLDERGWTPASHGSGQGQGTGQGQGQEQGKGEGQGQGLAQGQGLGQGSPSAAATSAAAGPSPPQGTLQQVPPPARAPTPAPGDAPSGHAPPPSLAMPLLDLWLRCLPLPGEAQGFFASLPQSAAARLRASACVPTESGAWVTPGRAAVCHSSAVRRLLSGMSGVSSPPSTRSAEQGFGSASAPVAAGVGAGGAHGGRLAGGSLLEGLHLVHPAASALHGSPELRAWLGVREFSPLQLVELAAELCSTSAGGSGTTAGGSVSGTSAGSSGAGQRTSARTGADGSSTQAAAGGDPAGRSTAAGQGSDAPSQQQQQQHKQQSAQCQQIWPAA